jgi:hypothetical protein
VSLDMAQQVRSVVDALGPPTPEQLARLRLILWGAQAAPIALDVPEAAADAA